MNLSNRCQRLGENLWLSRLGPPGIILSVLLVIHLAILTYVTAQDPFIFSRLGLDVIAGGFGIDALRSVAAWMAPGYPLLLALVMHVAGPFAVAWVNPVLLGATWLLIYRMALDGGLKPGAALLAVLVAMGLTFQSDPLAPHMMLYAFRGAPQFFCLIAAFYLISRSAPTRRRCWLVLASSLVLLGGATIREAVLLGYPGLVAWVLGNPAWRGARWRGLVWVAIAPLITGLTVFLLAGTDGGWLTRQGAVWLGAVQRLSLADIQARGLVYMHLFLAYAHGWGVVAMLMGVAAFRRRPDVLGLWVLPALGLFAFYALFMVHRRYALDFFVLGAVLGGLGAAHAVQWCADRLPSSVGRAMVALAVVAGVAVNLEVTRNPPMWGPRISRAEITAFTGLLRELEPDRERIIIGQECPFLVEAAWIHAGVRPFELRLASLRGLRDAPMLYVHAQAITTRRPIGVRTDAWLKHSVDLVPVLRSDGLPVTVQLGDLAYSFYRVAPWRANAVDFTLEPEDRSGSLIWLDFQNTPLNVPRHVMVENRRTGEVHEWRDIATAGLCPVWLDPQVFSESDPVHGYAWSDAAIPSDLVHHAPVRHGRSLFTLGPERIPSAVRWVRPPTDTGMPGAKWGATFAGSAAFEFPVPLGFTSGVYTIRLALEPMRRGEGTAVFTYRTPGQEPVTFTNRLSQARMFHDVMIYGPVAGKTVNIDLTAETVDAPRPGFRMVGLSMAVRPEGEAEQADFP
ncbi:MAG TPA: hypothetical protein PKE26_09495 [Kiritimatiellia bacterium]|nr:hypothetical protein [Kiritimatiellia bacterium]HMO99329.1 hypothetical protein [Kiritimatiellia bacterium]HMP96087.1 hypothetical protein [Kiritimatiellia bacterium]